MRLCRALAFIVAFCAGATRSEACSRAQAYGPVIPTSQAFFIGTATADTVLAGRGSVDNTIAPGRSGPPGGEGIYGQVISVRRAGGAAPKDSDRAVLVPWDYGADCRPIRWGASARWVAPGVTGLYTAYVRTPSEWVNGIPTYDVLFVSPEPYRGSGDSGGAGANAQRMHPDSLFDLMTLLPVSDEWRLSADSFARVDAWVRANPSAVRLEPAVSILRGVRTAIGRATLTTMQSPFLGTYRVTVSLSGHTPLSFSARTFTELIGDWQMPPRPRRPVIRLDPLRIDGYAVELVGVPDGTLSGPAIIRDSYVHISLAPSYQDTSLSIWSGEIETALIASQLAPDATLHAVLGEVGAYIPATFTLSATGRVNVSARVTLSNARSLTVTAERVSTVTFP